MLPSLPGVGRIVLATLLAEASEPLRRRDYHALRTLSGVAPVTKRSGKRCMSCDARLVMRAAAQRRLSLGARSHEIRPAQPASYAELRKRGHSHGRALRSVGDRLLAVACAMLIRRTPFDPDYAVRQMAA